MEKYKVLILGGSGFVGTKLIELKPKDISLFATFNTSVKDAADVVWERCDLLDRSKTKKVLEKIKSDIIINTSKTLPQAVKNIVTYAKQNNTRLIHLSSDAIFDGRKGNYIEQDQPNPITEYGKGKLIEEEEIEKVLDDYVIIRTSYVYGKSGGQWDKRTMNLLNSKKVSVYTNMFRSPTLVDDLANEIWKISQGEYRGILHVVGPKMNMYDFFTTLAKNVDVKIEIEKQKCVDNNITFDTSLIRSKY
ncbi:MAG: sugar nucleotide-binding protein [Patescibacteria group bacterium]|jgi:dTDP-4-dehydrorhamnose reductase